jgi:hypothetical protein
VLVHHTPDVLPNEGSQSAISHAPELHRDDAVAMRVAQDLNGPARSSA